MRRVWSFCVTVLLLVAAGLPGAARADAERFSRSVVGIEAESVRDARSAATLGSLRRASGAVIDDAGLILTIGFVVMEAERVFVRDRDGRRVPAAVVAYHAESGLGLVRAGAAISAPALRLADTEKLVPRARVTVVAQGGAGAALPAVVVARRAYAGAWEYLLERAIFTSPPHPHWTGAALIDGEGRLAGIGYLNVPDALPDGPLPGNMFVPVDLLKPILADLLTDGRAAGPHRPWVGVYASEVRGRLFVDRVAAGGPAQAAGIEPGDILLGVADRPVRGLEAFYRQLWGAGAAGAEIEFTVLRDLEPLTLRLRSADRYDWLRKPQSF
ncbi:MAG: S1C family serine protease [Alphaproteobacteria bacterium]